MITKLAIQNFRGLKDVTLNQLRRVNLLVGGNDTGKTSVLEAITLLLCDRTDLLGLPEAFRSSQRVSTFRIPAGPVDVLKEMERQQAATTTTPDDFENFWLWLFSDRNPANQILIAAASDDRKAVGLRSEVGQAPQQAVIYRTEVAKGEPDLIAKIQQTGAGLRPMLMLEQGSATIYENERPAGWIVSRLSILPSNPVEDAERYNQVALNADGEKRIEQVMREINPSVRRLRYAKLPGTSSPLVFVDLGLSRAIPSTQMGQAFNRLLHIYTEILSKRANVLLVDEIENGVFTSNLLPIWKGLLAVCEQEKVQVFATTHSLECVRAALAAAKERGKDELSVQRMQNVNGQIEAVALSQETLDYAVENNLEIRR